MTSLTDFIKEARKRGFDDSQIRKALLNYGWTEEKISQGFEAITPKFKNKNQICIFLSDELIEALEKRAKKNMFTLGEQIEDILRRSSIRKATSTETEKIDDLLVSCFSRSQRGRK